jgi:hypothetical protein
MFTRTLGFAILGVSLCAFGLQAGGGGKDGKDKKFEIPKDAIAGTVKSVDLKASKFTITLSDGKNRTFSVDDKTEFWGPKGGDRGTGATGLKDDCMAKGYEIRVVATKDAKKAKDVYLPTRKTETKSEEKKEK